MKRPQGRPLCNDDKVMIAIGVKLTSVKPDVSLLGTCIAVNKVYEKEGELCPRSLRRRVKACMGGVRWKELNRGDHISKWIHVLNSTYGTNGAKILDTVESACTLLLSVYVDNELVLKGNGNDHIDIDYDMDNDIDNDEYIL